MIMANLIGIMGEPGTGKTSSLKSLNPEETSRFSDQLKAYVQLRAQTEDGITFASNQELITVYPINNEMIAEDPDLPVPEPGDSVVLLDGSTI